MINKIHHHFCSVFTDQELKQWFHPLLITTSEKDKEIKVVFPHNLFASWFMEKPRASFEYELKKCLGDIEIDYIISGEKKSLTLEKEIRHKKERLKSKKPFSISLDRELSFDNFIHNNKNSFTLSAIKKALNTSPYEYFPFIIHGESGSGKSHLLSAMANSYKNTNRGLFFHGKAKSLFTMNRSWLSLTEIKAFFLDDMHEISGNTELQNKFLNFFDHNKSSNILCVISIDCHPATYKQLPQKLCMRLASGLVLELKKPDLDVRLRYILERVKELSLDIDKKTALSLAQRYYDFRAIDGSLNIINAYKKISHKADDNISLILGKDSEKKIISPLDIINNTASYYGLEVDQLTGKKRTKDISKARQMAVYLCRELVGLPYAKIGRFFGGRDHSSILYTVRKIQLLKQSDKETNTQLQELRKLCISSR